MGNRLFSYKTIQTKPASHRDNRKEEGQGERERERGREKRTKGEAK